MANGHVEIHDPFSNHTGPNGSTDPKSTSDTESMEDTVEYRLLMGYAKRRRQNKEAELPVSDIPAINSDIVANGTTPSETTNKTEEKTKKKKKKKKKGWERLQILFRCVKPQTEEPEETQPPAENDDVTNRGLICETQEQKDEVKEEDKLEEVVRRLTEIANDIPFVPSEIEEDAPESQPPSSKDVEKMIALLLRKDGDRLNEEVLKNANIATELFWNYSFFKELINALLKKMGLKTSDPEAPGPQLSPKTQIAVTCEVTSRLSAVKTLPMSRLQCHGAQYLQDYFSSWARQQGGYEAAFEGDDDEIE